jgi:hypothetical protein
LKKKDNKLTKLVVYVKREEKAVNPAGIKNYSSEEL